MYHFQLDINDTIRQDSEYHFLASRKHGEWSQIGKKLVTKSMQEEMQGMVSCIYLYTAILNTKIYERLRTASRDKNVMVVVDHLSSYIEL
jgi:hypothetical protein